jgi:hypothetical protein
MQHMAVYIDEIAAVSALRDAMKIPYLVEQSALHSGVYASGADLTFATHMAANALKRMSIQSSTEL